MSCKKKKKKNVTVFFKKFYILILKNIKLISNKIKWWYSELIMETLYYIKI